MAEPDMTGYHASVKAKYREGKLPKRLAAKLIRTRTPKMFYQCLAANGYLSDIWDMKGGTAKYPWKEE